MDYSGLQVELLGLNWIIRITQMNRIDSGLSGVTKDYNGSFGFRGLQIFYFGLQVDYLGLQIYFLGLKID